MIRRPVNIFWPLAWLFLASAVAAGVLAGSLLADAARAADRPAQLPGPPTPSGGLTTDRPSPVEAGRTSGPDRARYAAAVSAASKQASPTLGMRPASAEAPRTATTLRGIASWYADPRRSGLYAAHPDYRWGMAPWPLAVCGPSGCATVTVVDAGPDRASQRAGRIVDLSPAAFRAICGPLALGLCRVTVTP